MMYLFDIILFSILVIAALVIGFWWSLILVMAHGDRGLIETVLAAIGLLAAYRWWKKRRQDDAGDAADIKIK